MRRPPLAGFAVSAVAHLVAVTVMILVVARETPLPPLFIDLTTAPAPRDEGRAAAPAARASLPAHALTSSTPRTPVAPRLTRRAPVVDPAESPPRTTPVPHLPPRPPDSPSTASDPERTASPSDAPAVTQASDEAAAEGITAAWPAPTSADGSAPSAQRSSGAGESVTAADAVPSGVGGGARAGQGLALATPGAVGAGGGSPGAPGAPGAEYAEYLARFRQRIQELLRYPVPARRRELSGIVHLEVTIQPNGAITDVAIVQSSSHTALDDAAVEAVRSLRPQPFPKGVAPRILQVRVPVVFELR